MKKNKFLYIIATTLQVFNKRTTASTTTSVRSAHSLK